MTPLKKVNLQNLLSESGVRLSKNAQKTCKMNLKKRRKCHASRKKTRSVPENRVISLEPFYINQSNFE